MNRASRVLSQAMVPRTFVENAEELRAVLGEPTPRAANKERSVLHPIDMRAKLWEPSTWTSEAAPSRPRIAQEVEARETSVSFTTLS